MAYGFHQSDGRADSRSGIQQSSFSSSIFWKGLIKNQGEISKARATLGREWTPGLDRKHYLPISDVIYQLASLAFQAHWVGKLEIHVLYNNDSIFVVFTSSTEAAFSKLEENPRLQQIKRDCQVKFPDIYINPDGELVARRPLFPKSATVFKTNGVSKPDSEPPATVD